MENILESLWYGIKYGISSPHKAYRAGKPYGRIIAWILGVSAVCAYPISIIMGLILGSTKYYLSAGPDG